MKSRIIIQARRFSDNSGMNLCLKESMMGYKNYTPKKFSEVPGPRELPMIGNSFRFLPLIGQYNIQQLDQVTKTLHEKYGKIVKVGGLVGHPDLLFIYDPDEIRNVLLREEKMPFRPTMPSLHRYKMQMQREFFGDSLGVIGVHGKLWENFRAKVQHVMLHPKAAENYVGVLQEISEDFIEHLAKNLDENRETRGNFLHELFKWALECVGQISLDVRLGCVVKEGKPNLKAQKIIESINTFLWTVTEVELRLPIWRVYKTKAYKNYIDALDCFRLLSMEHIRNRMENLNQNTSNSILETILRKTGDPKIATALALDLMLVGIDTSSTASISVIYQLSRNLEKQEILYRELQSVLIDKNSKMNFEMFSKLPYLRACIREALRMYPVVIGNGRILQSDAVISGYEIPKGTCVIFPHYVLSNSEDHFWEPQKFLPERWLKSQISQCPERSKKIHPYASLPFGIGRRICLGKRFADAEMIILLAKLFRKFQVKYNYGIVKYKVNPSFVPEKPLKFQLLERE